MGLVELLQHPGVVRLHRAESLLSLLVPLLKHPRALPRGLDLSLKLTGAERGGNVVAAGVLWNRRGFLLALEVNLERGDERLRVAELLTEVRHLARVLAKVGGGRFRGVRRGRDGELQPRGIRDDPLNLRHAESLVHLGEGDATVAVRVHLPQVVRHVLELGVREVRDELPEHRYESVVGEESGVRRVKLVESLRQADAAGADVVCQDLQHRAELRRLRRGRVVGVVARGDGILDPVDKLREAHLPVAVDVE